MITRGDKNLEPKPSRLEAERRIKFGELFKTVVEIGTSVHNYPPSQTTLYDIEVGAQATLIPTDNGFQFDRLTNKGLSNVYEVTIDTIRSTRGDMPFRITDVNLTAQLVYTPPSPENSNYYGFHAKYLPPVQSNPFNITWHPQELPVTMPEVTPRGLEPGFPPEGIDVIRSDFNAVQQYLVVPEPKRFY